MITIYFYLYCLCGHSLVLDAVQTQLLKPHRSRAVEGREQVMWINLRVALVAGYTKPHIT